VVRVGLLIAATLLIAWAVSFQVGHRMCCGHFAPLGPHVDALSGPGSIGIPGQTTLYWAEVTNFGLWPLTLTACDYTTDALQRETEFAYGVQRWDPTTGTWKTVSAPNPDSFCQPTPLGRVDTVVRPKLVWPSQTMTVMEFEALGAWDAFRKGDVARFVLFRTVAMPIDWSDAVASDAVRIQDEAVRGSGPFRLRH
jgi:hypothetical protein